MKKKIVFIGVLLTIVGLLLIGCNQVAEKVTLNISAAASMQDVLEKAKSAYEEKYKEDTIVFNFGSSGSLQQQIEQGAPVDVFISAADKQMNQLMEKGLILDGSKSVVAENRVVLIAPKNQETLKDWMGLEDEKIAKIAIGEPESVPVGVYGKDVLNYFKIYDKIEGKFVYGKSVREVLSWVASGNVDAGIVYLTDAKISEDVRIVAEAPSESHKPVVYPGAVIKASKQQKEAQRFLDFLVSSEGQDIFKSFGFTIGK